MKAAIINSYGGPEVIQIAEMPRPVPGAGQILVRSVAGSFNPADAAVRSGVMKAIFPVVFPYTLGADVAGIVVEVGADVANFSVGDHVFGYANWIKNGSLSEYVAIDADATANAPTTIPLVDAASLPLIGCTAWQALFVHADLQAGQTILIVGAAGGVGSIAVQLAKWKGAHVIATTSSDHVELVRSLGADAVIDRKAGGIEDQVAEAVDVILNLSGLAPDDVTALLSKLKPGGILVSAASPAAPAEAERLNVRTLRMASQRYGAHLALIARLIDTDFVRPVISARYPLSELAAVHAKRETFGKVVLTIGDPT